MYHTTVKKSEAVRLVLVARLPQTSTSFLSENNERRIVELEEHWMCWAGPLGVIWAGVSTMQISAIIPEPWQKGFR